MNEEDWAALAIQRLEAGRSDARPLVLRGADSGRRNVDLQGRLYGPAFGSRLAMFFPGWKGRYYDLPALVGTLRDRFVDRGFAFATVDLPGMRDDSDDETLAQSEDAAGRWVAKFRAEGYQDLVGISLCAATQKVMRTEGIDLLLALSPIDFSGLVREEARSGVERPFWSGGPDTFHELSADGGRWDIFPSRRKSDVTFRSRASASVHVLTGSSDHLQDRVSPFGDFKAELRRQGVPVWTVPRAGHGFGGREGQLAECAVSIAYRFFGVSLPMDGGREMAGSGGPVRCETRHRLIERAQASNSSSGAIEFALNSAGVTHDAFTNTAAESVMVLGEGEETSVVRVDDGLGGSYQGQRRSRAGAPDVGGAENKDAQSGLMGGEGDSVAANPLSGASDSDLVLAVRRRTLGGAERPVLGMSTTHAIDGFAMGGGEPSSGWPLRSASRAAGWVID